MYLKKSNKLLIVFTDPSVDLNPTFIFFCKFSSWSNESISYPKSHDINIIAKPENNKTACALYLFSNKVITKIINTNAIIGPVKSTFYF